MNRLAAPLARTHAALYALRIAALVALAMPLAVAAQTGFAKLDPAPPVGITTDEIVKKFAARETDFAQARQDYVFRQTVKIDTIDDSGKVDGEYQ